MKKTFLIACLMLNTCFATSLVKQSMTINNHELNYYKTGSGEPLVMLMGYGLTNNFWPKEFVDCLSQNHTVYILNYLDEPSLELMALDVNSFIIQAKLDHPEVIGWSMGGGIAMTLANKYPHSISKIGLLSSIIADPGVSQIVPQYKSVSNSTNEKLNYIFGINIHHYQPKKLSLYKNEMLEKNDILVNDDVLNKQKNALANWMQDANNYDMMSHISIPTNIIIASNDIILNPRVQWDAFENFPNSQVTIIDNIGHAVFYERPQQVCQAVLN